MDIKELQEAYNQRNKSRRRKPKPSQYLRVKGIKNIDEIVRRKRLEIEKVKKIQEA